MKTVTIAIKEDKRDYLEGLKRKGKYKSIDRLFDPIISYLKESIKRKELELKELK